MANPIMKKLDPVEVAKQAVEYARSNPCCICSCEGWCGVKYKGTCKIARKIRLSLWHAKEPE